MVQIMAWHWIANKPLPEPIGVYFADPYASLILSELNENWKL